MKNDGTKKIPDGAQAVSRAFSILELVVSAQTPVKLADIAAQIDLHRNTTYRLAKTLVALGYLEDADGGYAAGVKTITLGLASGRKSLLLRKAEPHLQALCDVIGEVTNLGVTSGDEVFYLGRWEQTDTPPGIYIRTGQHAPLYASALGKVFLSSWSYEERVDYYRRCKFSAFTESTLTSAGEIEGVISHVKETGFAEDLGELSEGVRCIAVPIQVQGHTVAAISISFPFFRFKEERKAEYMQLLTAAAKRISVELSTPRIRDVAFDE